MAKRHINRPGSYTSPLQSWHLTARCASELHFVLAFCSRPFSAPTHPILRLVETCVVRLRAADTAPLDRALHAVERRRARRGDGVLETRQCATVGAFGPLLWWPRAAAALVLCVKQSARIRLVRQPLGPRARVFLRSFEKANIIPRTDLKYGRRANCLGIMLILAAVTH